MLFKALSVIFCYFSYLVKTDQFAFFPLSLSAASEDRTSSAEVFIVIEEFTPDAIYLNPLIFKGFFELFHI